MYHLGMFMILHGLPFKPSPRRVGRA